MDHGVSRNQILNELNRSAHGNLKEYGPIINEACRVDAEFLSHLIAYDFTNGQIKDSKIALPVLTVAHREFPEELVENSLAHIAMQPPRELLKSLRFSFESQVPSRRQKGMEKMIREYLHNKEKEPGKWARLAARHRRSLKSLYALTHAPAPEWVSAALFGFKREDDKSRTPLPYAQGSIFADIASLHRMDPAQAAATIQKWHLSPLVVSGAMSGSKAQDDSAVVQATMNQMSDTEIVTRAKSLEKKGLSRDAALKETFRSKVAKATKSKKATLKTGVAADEVEDESLKTMLKELQERQIQAQKDSGRGIGGNWLVISDKSGSQAASIELGKSVASAIAKFVSGKVWLAFCDTGSAGFEVTGMSLEKIKDRAKYITANGGTSYGVGLEWAAKQDIDGIAIVGDGAENRTPFFAQTYAAYKQVSGKNPPVYLYRTASTESPASCLQFKQRMDAMGFAFSGFDLSHGKVDYYSIPNLAASMSVNRFSLIDRVMACPLLTLDRVFGKLAVAA